MNEIVQKRLVFASVASAGEAIAAKLDEVNLFDCHRDCFAGTPRNDVYSRLFEQTRIIFDMTKIINLSTFVSLILSSINLNII